MGVLIIPIDTMEVSRRFETFQQAFLIALNWVKLCIFFLGAFMMGNNLFKLVSILIKTNQLYNHFEVTRIAFFVNLKDCSTIILELKRHS